MKMRSVMGALAAAALLFTGPALAIEAEDVGRRIQQGQEPPPYGLDARVGLGALQGQAGDETNTGPLIGISAGAQVHPDLGVEMGYEGQRFPVDSTLVGSGEGIYRHNWGLTAKAGPLLAGHLRPFVAAGAGLSYFNPSEGAENVFRNDVAFEVPLSVGLDYNIGNVFAGARGSYNLLMGEGFADDLPGGGGGNILNGTLMVGGRF
jgi:hypothetical protein